MNSARRSEEWLAARLAGKRATTAVAKAKDLKYKNVPVFDEPSGKMIQSGLEKRHLDEMRNRFRAGDVDIYAPQARIKVEGGHYVADILYGNVVQIDGQAYMKIHLEDSKGAETPIFRRSKTQIFERYGIEIDVRKAKPKTKTRRRKK